MPRHVAALLAIAVSACSHATAGNSTSTFDAGTKFRASGSTTPRSLATRAADVVNVKDFGAMGDSNGTPGNGSDDSTAIRAAIRASLKRVGALEGAVHFPPGIYRITAQALFSDYGMTNVEGIKFYGDNHRGTVIFLDNSSGTKWFYDNGTSATPGTYFPTFQDLTFRGSDPLHVNGFREVSSGHEQAFHFHNCRFESLGIGFRFEGTGNADRNVWQSCHFYDIGNLVELSNSQSVDHIFLACDAAVYGDLIHVDTGGGGVVAWFGGSIVVKARAGAPVFLYNNPGTAGTVSPVNGIVNFFQASLEFNDALGGIVNAPSSADWALVNFWGCQLGQTQGGARDSLILAAGKTVAFWGSVVSTSTHRVRFKAGTPNANQDSNELGAVTYDGCWLDQPPSASTVTYEAGAYGQVIGRGNHGSTSNAAMRDFHYNWKAAGPGTALHMKYVMLVNSSMYMPFNTPSTAEHTVVLPEGSVIVGIHVVKPAAGGTNALYQLSVGSGDKGTVYGSSTVAPQRLAHIIHVNDLWLEVGADLSKRAVRIWQSSAATGHDAQPGFALVEYL